MEKWGRWGSAFLCSHTQTPPITYKPPCTLQPLVTLQKAEGHTSGYLPGPPLPLGSIWREGQTEELAMFIKTWCRPHPGSCRQLLTLWVRNFRVLQSRPQNPLRLASKA